MVIQEGETPLNVLKENKLYYMWLYCSRADSSQAAFAEIKNIVLFDYQNGRARACPMDFLGNYSGYLQSDGYRAYPKWLMLDAKKLQGKGKAGKADIALAQTQKLYTLESRLKTESAEKRWAERQQHAKSMLDKLYVWLTTQKVIDSSALLYSIIETAKVNGLILYDYMVKCMKELTKPDPDIDSLLPWNFSH